MCVIENREIKGIFLRKWIIAQSDVIRCRFTTFYTFFPHCFVVVHIKTWSVTLLLEAWQIYYLGPTSTCVNYEILVPCRARVRWRQRTLVGVKFYAAWRFHEVCHSSLPFFLSLRSSYSTLPRFIYGCCSSNRLENYSARLFGLNLFAPFVTDGMAAIINYRDKYLSVN